MRAYEFLTEEQRIDEGLRDHILAAVAAAGITLGGQAAAETVFVYQDGNSLQTVEQFMDIPDDAPMAYAIDTDTMQIKMIKGDSPMVQKAEVSDPQAQADIERFMSLHGGEGIHLQDIKHITLDSGQRAVIGRIFTGKGNPLGAGKGMWHFVYTPTGLANPFGGLVSARWAEKPDAFKEGKGAGAVSVIGLVNVMQNPNDVNPAMREKKLKKLGKPVQILNYDVETGEFSK